MRRYTNLPCDIFSLRPPFLMITLSVSHAFSFSAGGCREAGKKLAIERLLLSTFSMPAAPDFFLYSDLSLSDCLSLSALSPSPLSSLTPLISSAGGRQALGYAFRRVHLSSTHPPFYVKFYIECLHMI